MPDTKPVSHEEDEPEVQPQAPPPTSTAETELLEEPKPLLGRIGGARREERPVPPRVEERHRARQQRCPGPKPPEAPLVVRAGVAQAPAPEEPGHRQPRQGPTPGEPRGPPEERAPGGPSAPAQEAPACPVTPTAPPTRVAVPVPAPAPEDEVRK